MPDRVSWLQIAQGWKVVGSDGAVVGEVAQIEGDKHEDIFDGLAVDLAGVKEYAYVPGEQVGAIYPGEVHLKVASTVKLEPFTPAPPETKWTAGKPPLSARLSGWLRGKR